MSNKTRNQRQSSNAINTSTESINEKILKECYDIYSNPENGLVSLADFLELKLLAPRKKINILLIGNHSAGKSSFVNWYIEKHVQKEGVAIETQGITFVTNGRKRETLTGNATLHLYPQFEPLRIYEGIMRYLSTEICDSIAKRFPVVTFIDTPGLVDGNMNYAFDVNEVLLYLGNHSDLIFVFFDPIGQALCKRTMTIIGKLGETHAERMHFYLSKSDEAGDETDRQRVLMQITQEVCKYPSLNRTCFDIQTIYNPNRAKPTRCVNQIEESAKAIEKVIQLTIQNTLNQLEKDCDQIAQTVEKKLAEDKNHGSHNTVAFIRSSFLYLIGFILPLVMTVGYFARFPNTWQSFSETLIGNETTVLVLNYAKPVAQFVSLFPVEEYFFYIIGSFALFILGILALAKIVGRRKPRLTRKEKRKMNEINEYVQNVVKSKKRLLYDDYLKQSVKENDL